MAIRLYDNKIEFDYDSGGSTLATHIVYFDSDGIGSSSKFMFAEDTEVTIEESFPGYSTGVPATELQIQPAQVVFGQHALYPSGDGNFLTFTGTISGCVELPAPATQAQGTVAGFVVGGSAPSYQCAITRFAFASDTSFACVGNVILSGDGMNTDQIGASSANEGFLAGGGVTGSFPTTFTCIQKFPWAISSASTTDVGDLQFCAKRGMGAYSLEEGFVGGGYNGVSPFYITCLQKYPFAISGGTSSCVGQLIGFPGTQCGGGFSDQSAGFGYTAGSGFPVWCRITKYPFAISNAGVTYIACLNRGSGTYYGTSNTQSTTDAFYIGGTVDGFNPVSSVNIDKFPFAISSGTSTCVAGLSFAIGMASGLSSDTASYVYGGCNPGGARNWVYKVPFAIASPVAVHTNAPATVVNAAGLHD